MTQQPILDPVFMDLTGYVGVFNMLYVWFSLQLKVFVSFVTQSSIKSCWENRQVNEMMTRPPVRLTYVFKCFQLDRSSLSQVLVGWITVIFFFYRHS